MLLWIVVGVVLAALILFRSARYVNLSERGVVYTLGRYSRTTGPGTTLLLPFMQTLRCVDTMPRTAGTELDDALTADGRQVRARVFVTYQVADAGKYAANLSGPRDNAYSRSVIELAIIRLLERTVRERIASLSTDELGARQEQLAAELADLIGDEVGQGGIGIIRRDLYCEPAPEGGTVA